MISVLKYIISVLKYIMFLLFIFYIFNVIYRFYVSLRYNVPHGSIQDMINDVFKIMFLL